MRLLQLSIENFKGIKSLSLEPEGKNLSIYGDNATGKTTIADAICWLLFNKDSRGQADFGVKNWSRPDLNKADHVVEARFNITTDTFPNVITLKKVFKEKWTRRRGSAEDTFDGHTTTFFADRVPLKEKEYMARVAEICPEHLFSILSSPTAFSALHWQKQREILLKVCGDVSDADTIASSPEFARLPEILAGKKTDDWKKVTAARRTAINKRLVEIPARIDELTKSRPELAVTNTQTLIATLTKLREQLDAKTTEIAGIQAGGGVVEFKKRWAVQEGVLRDMQSKVLHDIRENKNKHNAALTDANFRLSNVSSMLADTTRQVARLNEDIAHITETTAALTARWREVKARTYINGACPTCGQDLPADQLEAAMAKFNQAQSEELENIESKGFANKARMAGLQKQVEEATALCVKLETDKREIDAEVNGLIATGAMECPAAESTPAYQNAVRERDALLVEIMAGKIGDVTAKAVERDAIQEQIVTAEKQLAAIEQHMETGERITVLANEEKTLAGEYARLDGELHVVEQFTRAKVALLDERVNQKFEFVRFKMFEQLQNGGIEDTCKMTVDGVPGADLNSAARIQGGLDIIRTLSAHYKITLPVVIDNRESVTTIPEMNGVQVISLFVSEADKKLRVEVEA
jgi:DNA repair exonuclease SbcCD ATPase subunit